MYIVINCLGMPFDGNTIKERSLGGSETAAYYMAKELVKLGHKVTMFTAGGKEDAYDGVQYINAGTVTERSPLGDKFHFYAENTPHDVLIIQRHPKAFITQYASKINLWWIHDLANIRSAPMINSQMWNIDGVLCVSEFHKKQYCEVTGLNPEIVFPITNGVDLDLYVGEIKYKLCKNLGTTREVSEGTVVTDSDCDNRKKLIYSSRPERGLEHLVAPDGIMDRLYKLDASYHLYVCGYDNTVPQMVDYYNFLFSRCNEMPNVTFLGALTKQQLADVQRQCDLHVYPLPGPQQPDFDEVSCITAMECMAAGLPMMVSNRGAITETCAGAGCILMEPNTDGMPILQDWVDGIDAFFKTDVSAREIYKQSQLKAAFKFAWANAASKVVGDIIPQLMRKNNSVAACAKNMLLNSDIYCLKELLGSPEIHNTALNKISEEVSECYEFAFENTFAEHYAAYYEYEKNRGVNYGPENLDNNERYKFVAGNVSNLPSGSIILDYGCAHGHYTVNLAKRFPDKGFIGVDIAQSNIDKAKQWAANEGVENAIFICGSIVDGRISTATTASFGYSAGDGNTEVGASREDEEIPLVDFIIAAEVIEHVANPVEIVDALREQLKDTGRLLITTPFGPWEAIGYREHYPWRAHLYHFDRADIQRMYGHHPKFELNTIPAGMSKWGTPLGSFVYSFGKGVEPSRIPDYKSKIENYVPKVQTLSVCMIVKDAEETLLKCLNSIKGIADEIIIGIDDKSKDSCEIIIDNFSLDNLHIKVTRFYIESPTVTGFDVARNSTIEKATCDWIMWIDSDEFLVNPDAVFKYLRNNQYNGYALQQHHISMEPVGLLKTDLPVRLFRNHHGIKFFGVVHEHPELELNKGIGHAQAVYDLQIAHGGYTTESIRRGRFHRNIDLLVRDREKYPERVLGKMLWLRDLAQMSKYELEMNGGRISPEMHRRADEGIKIWRELVKEGHVRMVLDSMEFYSMLCQIKGSSFEFGFTLDASKMNGGLHLQNAQPVMSHFANKDDVLNLLTAITEEKVKDYEKRYF